jgi:MEMO1 family protein
MDPVREAVVNGTFYPDNPEKLTGQIKKYLDNAEFETIEGAITGMISPHAGYVYSGQVAAYGMKALSGSPYDTVIVIAPSHRKRFEGAAVMVKGSYRTPLGLVGIDEETAAAVIREGNDIFSDRDAHILEHALEVQIPFLQVVLKDFKIVPIIMGTQETHICNILSAALHKVINGSGKRFLVVGSSDLSHYYPYDHAKKLDEIVIRCLEKYDIQGMTDAFDAEKCEACGKGPIITTMLLSKLLGATKSRVLKYANSGDVSGDKSSVVGYVSAVFYKIEGVKG